MIAGTRPDVPATNRWSARLGGRRLASARQLPAGVAAFVLVFGALMVFSLHVGRVAEWYDSGQYASAPDSFSNGGHFSLLAWDSSLRGYVLPLVDNLLTRAEGAISLPRQLLLKVEFAAAMAWLASCGLPDISARVRARSAGLGERLLVSAMFLVFWRGYVLYALSDVVGLALLVLAVVLLLRLETRKWLRTASLVCGIATGAAVNIRPSFLVAVLPLVGLFWLAAARSRRPFFVLIVGSWAVTGAVLVLLPQSLINREHGRPLNPTKFTTPAGLDLYVADLDFGLRFPKYMTNVGDPSFPMGGVRSRDPSGDELWSELVRCCTTGTPPTFGYGDYARFVRSRPLQVGEVYVRHVFNGIDLWHSTPYLDRVPPGRALRLLNATTWFAFLVVGTLGVLRGWPRRVALPGALTAGALVLPVVLSVPGSIEERYFLPLHALVYCVVAWALTVAGATVVRGGRPSRPRVVALLLSRRSLLLAGAWVVWVAVWFTVSDGVVARLSSS